MSQCSYLPLLCLRLSHLWQPVEALVARGVVWVVQATGGAADEDWHAPIAVVHWTILERRVVGHYLPADTQGDAHVGEEGRCAGMREIKG